MKQYLYLSFARDCGCGGMVLGLVGLCGEEKEEWEEGGRQQEVTVAGRGRESEREKSPSKHFSSVTW